MATKLMDVKAMPGEEILIKKAQVILAVVYDLGFIGNLKHIEIDHLEVRIIYESSLGEQSIKRRFTNAN